MATPQQQQPSLLSAEGGFQMSVPPISAESFTTHSGDYAEAPVEEFEEDHEVPTEKSNQTDPKRRAGEFRARHIQMMALGNYRLDLGKLLMLNRRGHRCRCLLSVW